MAIINLLDLFFPKFCLGCQNSGSYLCENCSKKLILIEKQSCPACGLLNEDGSFCNQQCKKIFFFDQMITCMIYDKESLLKKLITLFKYKFSEELNEVLGEILIRQFEKFKRSIPGSNDFVLIPVPLHKKRLKFRGFNQAKLLAECLSENTGNMCIYDCLERTVYVKEQAKLNRAKRLINLKNTIKLKDYFRDDFIQNRTVILIDDVATTGSTLNECSRVLKAAGVKYICGLTLARVE